MFVELKYSIIAQHSFVSRNQPCPQGYIQSSGVRKRFGDERSGSVSHDETGGRVQPPISGQVSTPGHRYLYIYLLKVKQRK